MVTINYYYAFCKLFCRISFWIISGLLGKRKLEIKQDDTRNKLPYSSSGTHKSSYKKYHSLSIPRLNKIPEGPENGIAGFIDVGNYRFECKKR